MESKSNFSEASSFIMSSDPLMYHVSMMYKTVNQFKSNRTALLQEKNGVVNPAVKSCIMSCILIA